LVQVPTQSDISAEIILSEHFFSTINWGLTLSNLKSRGEQTRNILGARVIESDLPWRYFVKKSQQMIDMQLLKDQRANIEEQILQKLSKDLSIPNEHKN
jgi:hypothetical protein